MWFNLSLLSKKMDFCQKGLAAYKQNSAGNGFVDHKEGQGLLLTETTGPPNTASTESRGTSWPQVYPYEAVLVFTSKSCVRPFPHPHTHMHTHLPVPIWCPWFILKVLPRAFLQQHALIGGSDQKKGGINQQSGIMPFVNFCKFLLLHQTEKLKGKPRGN